MFEEKHSSSRLLCLSFSLFSLRSLSPCEPACVYEWVKHCHSPIASLEMLLQTDWRSTAKGSLAGCVCDRVCVCVCVCECVSAYIG